jgi:hypothetical protein
MTNIDDISPLNYNFKNIDERLNIFFKLLDIARVNRQNPDLTTDDISDLIEQRNKLDPLLGNSLLSEQKLVEKFFESIIDQQAHFSTDHKRLRQLIIDWYASHRTMVSSMRKSIDAYYLSNEELDELIKSFGFPYPNKIISKDAKVGFLYSLISYQKRKGTPWAFSEGLNHFGLMNTVVSEWWIHRNHETGEFYFKSQPVYPRKYKNDSDYILVKTLDQIQDPFWFQTQENLQLAWSNSSIKVPSITPFISVHSTLDYNRLIPGIAILQRWVDETYAFWIEYVLSYKNTVQGTINNPSTSVTYGDTYIIGNTPIGIFLQKENYYAYALHAGNWRLGTPKENDCILNAVTNTHWVYNGTEWIDLNILLPVSLLKSKHRPLNKDVRLTNFRKKYSIIEVMLAIIYMFDSKPDTVSDPRYYYYNGRYAPLDTGETISYSGYSGGTFYSGSEVFKDNKINVDMNNLYSEWASLSRRPKTKQSRDYLLNARNLRFTEDVTLSDSTDGYTSHAICAMDNCGTFLSAINGTFKSDIDNMLSYKDRIDVMRLMLLDFEQYLMEQSKIIDIPLSYMMLGSPLNTTLRDVLNYFKPYRARLVDVTASYGIMDKLGDSILESDTISCSVGLSWIDRYIEIRDELYETMTSGFYDYFQRRGEDHYYYFDHGVKDGETDGGSVFTPVITKKFDEILGLTSSEDFKTHRLYFVDQCPGSGSNSDASTISDSLTISIITI